MAEAVIAIGGGIGLGMGVAAALLYVVDLIRDVLSGI